MPEKRSLIKFYTSLVILFFIGVPGISISDDATKTVQQPIKSASELDYPPFSIVRSDGTADGFSVELLRSVANAMGKDISFLVGPWHEIKQNLIESHLDVLPLVSYSKERDETLDFSAPYLRMHGTIFVRKGETSIQTETDLIDKEVLVMKGDTAHEYAIRKKLSDTLILKDTFEEAFQDLSRGKHDALIIQQLVGLQLIKKLKISNIVDISTFDERDFKLKSKPLSGFEQKFCFAVPEGKKELLSLLNEGLSIVIVDGTFDKLYQKWFGPVLPKPTISFAMKIKSLLLYLVPILFLFLIFGLWFLKREVARKTAHLQTEISERKTVEQTIRENEELFRTVFEQTGGYCMILKPTDSGIPEILDANEAACEIHGYTKEELIGRPVADLDDEEGKKQCRKNTEIILSGQTLMIENNHLRKDGTTFPVAVFANRVEFDDKPPLIVTTEFDISEQKEREGLLRDNIYVLENLSKIDEIFRHGTDAEQTINNILEVMLTMFDCDRAWLLHPCDPDAEYWTIPFERTRPEYPGASQKDEKHPMTPEVAKDMKELLFDEKLIHGNYKPGEAEYDPNDEFSIKSYLVSVLRPKVRQPWEIGIHKCSHERIWTDLELMLFQGVKLRMEAALSTFLILSDLKNSEERFNLAMDASQDGLYDWDLVTNEIYYSPAWKRMLGYNDHELPNDFSIWENLTEPEDVKRAWKMQNELINKKRDRFEMEFKMKHKDGSWVDILSRANAVFNENGEAIRVIGTHVDISERKKSEEALNKQNYYLEKAQELGKIGTWELDLVDNKLVWTDENCRIFGVPEGSVVDYKIFLSKVHPDDREYVDSEWKAALKGKPYDIEHKLLIGDEVKWVREKADIKLDDSGKAIGAIGFTQDITVQKQSVEELNRIFELSPDLIGFGNVTKGYYTRVNPAYKIFGRPLDEFLTRPYVEFIHPEDHNATASIVTTMQSGQSISGFVNRYRCKDGSYRTIEWRATDAQPDGSVCVAGRDITDRIKSIEEKKKLEKQLQQSKKLESIGQLAGGIAHDFNNILYPILGFTQMSMDELPENHPVRENLQDVMDGAKRARDLVKRILLFSRQKEKKLEPLLVKPVIEESLKLLRSSIPVSIDIQSEFYDGGDLILCDETEIHEIIMNLCTNAYHSMDEKGDTIRINLDKKEPPPEIMLPGDEYLCLSVSDNGAGIEPQYLQNIFEPYFTTKEVGKGSGLGLSVVHGIVKSYQGEIIVESSLGKGTVFKIFLPITDQSNISLKEKESSELLMGDEKILFVDDEKAIVKLGTRVLEKVGFTVTGAEKSPEALALITKNPEEFDLIITDMTMPGMVGTELAKKIFEIKPDIPVLICSGYSEKLDKSKTEIQNIRGYLDKPILADKLIVKVREILDRNQG